MITAMECATMHSRLTEQEIKDKFPWVISALNEFASRNVLEAQFTPQSAPVSETPEQIEHQLRKIIKEGNQHEYDRMDKLVPVFNTEQVIENIILLFASQQYKTLLEIDSILLKKAKDLNLYVDFSEKTYDGDKEAPMDRFGLLDYLINTNTAAPVSETTGQVGELADEYANEKILGSTPMRLDTTSLKFIVSSAFKAGFAAAPLPVHKVDAYVQLLKECVDALNRTYDATEWPADGSSNAEQVARKVIEWLSLQPVNYTDDKSVGAS